MKNVFFKPWVGENYSKPLNFSHRILVLGESFHCGGCEECGYRYNPKSENPEGCEDLNSDTCVRAYLDKTMDGRFRSTYTTFLSALSGIHSSQLDGKEIYDDIIFYNYLQEALPYCRQSPTYEQWNDSHSSEAFFEVLEKYRPEKVIAWGKRLFQALPSENWSNENSEEMTGIYTLSDGTEIELLATYHPSSAFEIDYWHEKIADFLK